MEQLDSASAKLKAARDEHEIAYATEIAKLDDEEKRLRDRLQKLEEDKLKSAAASGNTDVSDDDLIEINAGGRIVAAKRGTLTQIKGTRLEALFSGRWDKKLPRDSNGRIFLDVNPECFQAILDYLNELAISSEDNPPEAPTVDDEHHEQHFRYQLELFGLSNHPAVLNSNIVKGSSEHRVIHKWLKEDGSEGVKELVYSSLRDGLSAEAFHSKCVLLSTVYNT